jgi:hypothetical protein
MVTRQRTQPFEDTALKEHALELVIVPKLEGQSTFVVLPKRWVVERTFAWLMRYRWLRAERRPAQPQQCQLSTVNCQLSTVNCQLSIVNCQLSIVNCRPYAQTPLAASAASARPPRKVRSW